MAGRPRKQEPIAVLGTTSGDNGAAGEHREPEGDRNQAGIRDDGTIAINPGAVSAERSAGNDSGGSGDEAGGSRRRGRPRGSRNKARSSQSLALDVAGLESILFSAHAMLAGITQVSELALDKDEAKQLASASAAVASHYNMAASQRTLDWANLLMVAGMVYGTRIAALSGKFKRAPKAPKTNSAQPAAPSGAMIPGTNIPIAPSVQ